MSTMMEGEPGTLRASRRLALCLLAGAILIQPAGEAAAGKIGDTTPSPKAKPTPLTRTAPSYEHASDEVFGITVTEYDDEIARRIGLLGGLRVLGIRPGSLGARFQYKLVSRPLDRGDFILRVRVAGVDPEELRSEDILTSKQGFAEACKRARRIVSERPEKKGEIVLDVWTLAGYNLEDYRHLALGAILDMNPTHPKKPAGAQTPDPPSLAPPTPTGAGPEAAGGRPAD